MKEGFGMDTTAHLIKQDVLAYYDKPAADKGHNRMGCSENWYDAYYAVTQTFARDEVEAMTDSEVYNLIKLGGNIAGALY